MKTSVCAIICAAGKGTRAGFEKNKLLVPYDGIPVLTRTVQAFCFAGIDELIVTYSPTDLAEMKALLSGFDNVRFVQGGETRTHSVYNALQEANSDIVLIHDGARPFVTRKIIEGCIDSVKKYGSGICAMECRDTVAMVTDKKIIAVPNRKTLRQIQTPQGFFRKQILSAYEQAMAEDSPSFTDDSSVFAKYCQEPSICDGDSKNIKITYAEDLQNNVARCGFGIDTHAFGKEQDYIVLAGVKIPSDSGLIAHSDGDVLVHAVMDSLLSAAGLKDIGHYFPDTDEKWKGANSMRMLEQVVALIESEGYGVQNISVAIQAEKPRMKKYIDQMKNALAGALKVDETAVGISAGTNEGLGYVGEGKGITVNAYALLHSI